LFEFVVGVILSDDDAAMLVGVFGSHNSLRVTQKAIFVFVLIKIRIQWNKVAYRVYLCENFQQQSYSMPFPHPTIHRYWRER